MTDKENKLLDNCLRLAQYECANCTTDGLCLLTDSPCERTLLNRKYSIADGAIGCEYFLTAVLPLRPELNQVINRLIWAERDLESDEEDLPVNLRQCVDCGKLFTPLNNGQKRCRECGVKARRRTNTDSHKLRYWRNR